MNFKSNMGFLKQVHQGKNNYWRWLLVLVVLLSPYLYGLYEYIFNYYEQLKAVDRLKNYKGNNNYLLLENLKYYFILLPLLFLAVKFIHKRNIKTLFTAYKNVRFKRVFFSFITFGLFIFLFKLIEYSVLPQKLIFQFDKERFFQLLAIVIFLVPIKIIFQETFFRGYLMQGIGLITNSKWMTIAFTTLIFGGVFSLAAASDSLRFNLLLFYLMTDIFLGIIVLMDEGNELTIGIEWMNNFFVYVIVTGEWMAFKTDSFFYNPASEPNYFFSLYLLVFLVHPLYLLFLSKVFGWKNWKEKLFGEIKKNEKY